MKKYSAYKDSGIEWIGEIPEHWDRVKLKLAVSVKISDGPHETPEWTLDGIPFLSAESIKGNKLDFKYKRGYISQKQHEIYSEKSKVIKGDILFCKSGSTTGKSAIVDFDKVFGIWSPLAIIRSSDEFHNRFLFQFMQSNIFRLQVETSWTFGTQPNIGMGALENLWVSFPSLPEQTSIANYLDRKTAEIDALIKKKKQLIVLYKEERTATINHAVTKGLDPNVPMKDSGIDWIGEIPEHWEVKPLKYCFDVFGGGTPSKENPNFWDGDIPWVSPKDMKSKEILNSIDHTNQLGISNSSTNLINEKALLMVVRSGILQHSLPVGINQVPVTINQDIKAFISVGIYSELMLYYFIKGCEGNLLDDWSKEGATVESIEMEFLLNFSLPIPTIDEQQTISSFLDSKTKEIDQLTFKTKREIELLEEYKKTLISEVVLGKVDVREEVIN